MPSGASQRVQCARLCNSASWNAAASSAGCACSASSIATVAPAASTALANRFTLPSPARHAHDRYRQTHCPANNQGPVYTPSLI